MQETPLLGGSMFLSDSYLFHCAENTILIKFTAKLDSCQVFLWVQAQLYLRYVAAVAAEHAPICGLSFGSHSLVPSLMIRTSRLRLFLADCALSWDLTIV